MSLETLGKQHSRRLVKAEESSSLVYSLKKTAGGRATRLEQILLMGRADLCAPPSACVCACGRDGGCVHVKPRVL